MKKLLEVNLIPRHVHSDIADMLGNSLYPTELQHLSEREALDAWLRWNGIIGWTEQILEVTRALAAAAAAAKRQANEGDLLS